ncbi:MAG: ABC transporter ATP-binding protein [Acidimicrobiales bacterium]
MLDVDIDVDRREFTVAVALAVAEGERVALFGPSGSGKSTVLETAAGLTALHRGHIFLGGRELARVRRKGEPGGPLARSVPPWRRRVALLRQDPGLFPHLSVAHNLTYARRSRSDRGAELAALVDLLELGGLLEARPDALSGGQQQRVALARALLSDYELLLLDEPYSGLDARLRTELTTLVRDQAAERGVPAILVAHELGEAQAFADRLGVLDRGCLLQIDAPHQVVRRPANRRVAELVGYRSFVPVPSPAARGLPPDSVLAVHPERTHRGSHPEPGVVLTGAVRGIRPSGAGFDVDLDVAGAAVVCRLAEVPTGSLDAFAVTVSDPPMFGSDGERVEPRGPGR